MFALLLLTLPSPVPVDVDVIELNHVYAVSDYYADDGRPMRSVKYLATCSGSGLPYGHAHSRR